MNIEKDRSGNVVFLELFKSADGDDLIIGGHDKEIIQTREVYIERDSLGRLCRILSSNGYHEFCDYEEGTQVQETGDGRHTHLTFDEEDRLIHVQSRSGPVTTKYQTIAPRSEETWLEYDEEGRPSQFTKSSGETKRFAYGKLFNQDVIMEVSEFFKPSSEELVMSKHMRYAGAGGDIFSDLIQKDKHSVYTDNACFFYPDETIVVKTNTGSQIEMKHDPETGEIIEREGPKGSHYKRFSDDMGRKTLEIFSAGPDISEDINRGKSITDNALLTKLTKCSYSEEHSRDFPEYELSYSTREDAALLIKSMHSLFSGSIATNYTSIVKYTPIDKNLYVAQTVKFTLTKDLKMDSNELMEPNNTKILKEIFDLFWSLSENDGEAITCKYATLEKIGFAKVKSSSFMKKENIVNSIDNMHSDHSHVESLLIDFAVEKQRR